MTDPEGNLTGQGRWVRGPDADTLFHTGDAVLVRGIVGFMGQLNQLEDALSIAETGRLEALTEVEKLQANDGSLSPGSLAYVKELRAENARLREIEIAFVKLKGAVERAHLVAHAISTGEATSRVMRIVNAVDAAMLLTPAADAAEETNDG